MLTCRRCPTHDRVRRLLAARRDLRRLRLDRRSGRVLDGMAADAAVVADAGGVDLGHRGLVGEVRPRLLGVDGAEVVGIPVACTQLDADEVLTLPEPRRCSIRRARGAAGAAAVSLPHLRWCFWNCCYRRIVQGRSSTTTQVGEPPRRGSSSPRLISPPRFRHALSRQADASSKVLSNPAYSVGHNP